MYLFIKIVKIKDYSDDKTSTKWNITYYCEFGMSRQKTNWYSQRNTNHTRKCVKNNESKCWNRNVCQESYIRTSLRDYWKRKLKTIKHLQKTPQKGNQCYQGRVAEGHNITDISEKWELLIHISHFLFYRTCVHCKIANSLFVNTIGVPTEAWAPFSMSLTRHTLSNEVCCDLFRNKKLIICW